MGLFHRRLKSLEQVKPDSDAMAHMPHAPAFRHDLRQEPLRNSFQLTFITL